MKRTIFTVGHSRHSSQDFLRLLKLNGINAVADVRSAPFSKFSPQFNKNELRGLLKDEGIAYVFLGGALGGRPSDKSVYRLGRVDYGLVAKTEWFRAGIHRLLAGAEKHKIALLCSERDPINCHRALLVGHAVVGEGVEVEHILPDGTTESNELMMRRLSVFLGLPVDDFFSDNWAVFERARELQSERVAFRDELEDSE